MIISGIFEWYDLRETGSWELGTANWYGTVACGSGMIAVQLSLVAAANYLTNVDRGAEVELAVLCTNVT